MSITAIGIAGVVGLLVAIFLRVPIAIALAAAGLSRLCGDRRLDAGAEDGGRRALPDGERLFAVGDPAVHPDGRGGIARQDGERIVSGLQRGVFRHPRRAGECHHRRLHAVRRDLRLLDRDRRDILARRDSGDAPARLRPGLRGRRGRIGRHAERADPAVGADRDLFDRRRSLAGQALCRRLHSRLRAGRALCRHGVAGRLVQAALDPARRVDDDGASACVLRSACGSSASCFSSRCSESISAGSRRPKRPRSRPSSRS